MRANAISDSRLRGVAAAIFAVMLPVVVGCAKEEIIQEEITRIPPITVQVLITGPVPEGAIDKSRGVKFSMKVASIDLEVSGRNILPIQKNFDIIGPQGSLLVSVGIPPGSGRAFEAIGYSGRDGKGEVLYRGMATEINIPNRPGFQVPVPMDIVGGLPPDARSDLPKWANENEAMLQGTVNPNAYHTKIRWEWGPTPEMGRTIDAGETLPGVVDQKVESKLSGLTSASTYFYRMIAENKAGRVQTDQRYFKTQPSEGETFMRDLVHIKVRPGIKHDRVVQIATRYNAIILEESIDDYIFKYLGTKPVAEIVRAMNEDPELQFGQVMPFHSRLGK